MSSVTGSPMLSDQDLLRSALLATARPEATEWAWPSQARPEQLAPPGDWLVWLIMAGRGWGKELCKDTPIPTPSGWTRLGDLDVGDEVFDETGMPCRVTAVYDSWPRQAWRLHFSDHTSLVAGDEHQWVTWTHADRKAYLRSEYEDSRALPEAWPVWRVRRRHWRSTKSPWVRDDALGPRVRTTGEIVATLRQGSRGDRNHSIPVCSPLDLPSAQLPIDPYVLGVWLGDGASASAEVTCHDQDASHYAEHFAEIGETWRFARRKGSTGTYTIGPRPPKRGSDGRMVANDSIHSRLAALGLLGDKHIPPIYLRASVAQRLALLQGLTDTDGHVEAGGQIEYCTTTPALAEGVLELARSLGEKPRVREGRATLNGKDCGVKFRVGWHPASVPPVSLPRKVARLAPPGAQHFRNLHRMIVDVTQVPAVPMRCITVDSPHSMYLAGDGMIPTHNTRTGAEWLARQAITTPRTEWAVIARTTADVRKTCLEGESGLLQALGLRRESPNYNRTTGEVHLPNSTVIYAFSADQPDAIRGPNLAGAWCDEIGTWRYEQTWTEGLMFAVRKGDRPQIVATTTPRRTKLLRDLVGREDGSVTITRGATFANEDHLSAAFLAEIKARYEGTRLGRQELYGELLEDVPGALWTSEMIERARATLVD